MAFQCHFSKRSQFDRQHRVGGRRKWLKQVVVGYFNYHAVPTNSCALAAFRTEITKHWRRVLSRRSQTGGVSWKRMTQLATDWLPMPHILHLGPTNASPSLTQGGSRMRASRAYGSVRGHGVTHVPTATQNIQQYQMDQILFHRRARRRPRRPSSQPSAVKTIQIKPQRGAGDLAAGARQAMVSDPRNITAKL